MVEYIYFVKCPDCDDETFLFFDEARDFATSCLSRKPIITQTEVQRNDFGECTDSCDLGTIWSWEEAVGVVTCDEPAVQIFTQGDFAKYNPDSDPEFDQLDNSFDVEPETYEVSAIDSVPDNFRKPIPEGMTIEQLVETLEEHEDSVECKTCFNLFPKADCTKQEHGYVCSTCSGAFSETSDCDETCVDDVLGKLVIDELDAIDGYECADEAIQHASIPEDKKLEILDTLEHIKTEEEEHIDELRDLSKTDTVADPLTDDAQLLREDSDNTDEDDEDTVECAWCNELFGKDQCRKEVDLGYLCSRCEAAIKSRGETLTFKENNYWDFLDESAKSPNASLETLEEAADYRSHLTSCPECGVENSFDHNTGFCLDCGFNI